MVQIFIKIGDENTKIKEWAIIELQGDVESTSGESITGKIVGQLYFMGKDKPVLIIGYHILFGRIAEINPPLAVLKRKRISSEQSSTQVQDIVVENKTRTEYEVLALVKKKLIFKTRPKPIVTMDE